MYTRPQGHKAMKAKSTSFQHSAYITYPVLIELALKMVHIETFHFVKAIDLKGFATMMVKNKRPDPFWRDQTIINNEVAASLFKRRAYFVIYGYWQR